jgi:hypothetical protein
LWVILDACEVGGRSSPLIDSDCTRRICAMARIYMAETNVRKNYLQSELYDHSIWNRVALWEESLMIVISEELIGRGPACEMNIDNFGHYMLMFGLSSISASNICVRVLDDYFPNVPISFRFLERLQESIRVAVEKQQKNIIALAQTSVDDRI